MEFPYKCDMLVDQNRYIGEDPIGYKCCRDAEFESNDYLFCPECMSIAETEPHRLIFPILGGKARQDEFYKEFIKSIS